MGGGSALPVRYSLFFIRHSLATHEGWRYTWATGSNFVSSLLTLRAVATPPKTASPHTDAGVVFFSPSRPTVCRANSSRARLGRGLPFVTLMYMSRNCAYGLEIGGKTTCANTL